MSAIRLRRRVVRPLSNEEPAQRSEPHRVVSEELFAVAAKLLTAEARIEQLGALPQTDDIHGASIRACLARLHVLDELRALLANAS